MNWKSTVAIGLGVLSIGIVSMVDYGEEVKEEKVLGMEEGKSMKEEEEDMRVVWEKSVDVKGLELGDDESKVKTAYEEWEGEKDTYEIVEFEKESKVYHFMDGSEKEVLVRVNQNGIYMVEEKLPSKEEFDKKKSVFVEELGEVTPSESEFEGVTVQRENWYSDGVELNLETSNSANGESFIVRWIKK